MQTLAEMKALLGARGLRPKRSLGQNFLIDHNLIRKVADSGAVRAGGGDLVLEVGPGTGALTEELLARGATVIACELDDALADLLDERMSSHPAARDRFTLIRGDCLENKHQLSRAIVAALAGRPFRLVANLPYGAATPLLFTLLVDHPACSLMSVMVQREVADRLLARPDTRDFGPLAVVAQALATVSRVATAPPQCFWPRPDVTSTIVLITRRADPLTPDPRALSAFARAIFAHRRKQLGAGVKAIAAEKPVDWPALAACPGTARITPTLRAEQLTVPEIIALRDALARQGIRPEPIHSLDVPPTV